MTIATDTSPLDDELALHLARREEALAKVRTLLVEQLKVPLPPERIDLDAPLFGTGLGLDSVDAVELVVALETKLGVRLPEGAAGSWAFRTVHSLVELVLDPPTEVVSKPTASAPLPELSPPVAALRTRAALHVASHDGLFHAVAVRGEEAKEALQWILPSRLHLRDAQARQSLLLDANGHPIADVIVAADDEDYLLLVDGLARDALLSHLRENLRGARATVEDLGERFALVSVHGPWAWELLNEAVSSDLVALPYLNFFRIDDLIVLRAGRTGEFGYHLLVPHARVAEVRARIDQVGLELGLGTVSDQDLRSAALEGWFFEPQHVPKDASPIELGLSSRLAPDRDFLGRAALEAREHPRRLVCLLSESPVSVGDPVTLGEPTLGVVTSALRSEARERFVAAALVDARFAHGGIDRFRVAGVPAVSVAPPLLDNRSLHVDARRHTFRALDEVIFGPLYRQPRATMAGSRAEPAQGEAP